ncbi:MAG: Na+/H+ antiporter NhaA [Acidimicrobiales bacterium]
MRHDHSARASTPARSLPGFARRFLATEAAGGIVLVAVTLIALAWANSPWQGSYERLWHNPVVVQLGSVELREDLRHIVNDGLMALFFFVVGLEIKREFVRGELADRRVAVLPVCAALGGMAVPALFYAALTIGTDAANGWGIPMATDIAFALGVLAFVAKGVPNSLKLLLLTLAVVDDIGAIIVIAIFYGGDLDLRALVTAGALLAGIVALRRLRVDWPPLYAVVGVAVWYATYRSGVHATIAGVALALLTPARPLTPTATVRRWAQDLSDEPTAADVRQMTVIARETVSPVEHLEERLHPFTSFVVLPCFALANAGVVIHADMLGDADARRAAAGVAIGLVAGKVLGIVGGVWLAVRTGVASMPERVRWRQIAGIGALGGIGFTVSLFISSLAFTDQRLSDAARLAIVVASTVSAVVGALLLRSSPPVEPA